MLALLLLTAWLRPCAAQSNELVMATTFSPSATVWIIDRWQKEPGSVMIRTLNRTSASLEQLLDTANAENVDLILTSSPMLLQHLQEHQKLAPFSGAPAVSQHLATDTAFIKRISFRNIFVWRLLMRVTWASLQINYNPCFFCNFSQRYLLFLHY